VFGERIKQFIDYKRLSVRSFEEKTGINQGTLARVIKKNTTITSENLKLIAQTWHILDIHWLLTGEGEMLKELDIQPKADYEKYVYKKDWHEDALKRADEEIMWQRKQIELLTAALIDKNSNDSNK